MCFHCGSERLLLVACHCPRTGMGPNAALCPWVLPTHHSSRHAGACYCHPFGELPDRSSPIWAFPGLGSLFRDL